MAIYAKLIEPTGVMANFCDSHGPQQGCNNVHTNGLAHQWFLFKTPIFRATCRSNSMPRQENPCPFS